MIQQMSYVDSFTHYIKMSSVYFWTCPAICANRSVNHFFEWRGWTTSVRPLYYVHSQKTFTKHENRQLNSRVSTEEKLRLHWRLGDTVAVSKSGTAGDTVIYTVFVIHVIKQRRVIKPS